MREVDEANLAADSGSGDAQAGSLADVLKDIHADARAETNAATEQNAWEQDAQRVAGPAAERYEVEMEKES
jgi:hypothetical protein